MGEAEAALEQHKGADHMHKGHRRNSASSKSTGPSVLGEREGTEGKEGQEEEPEEEEVD